MKHRELHEILAKLSLPHAIPQPPLLTVRAVVRRIFSQFAVSCIDVPKLVTAPVPPSSIFTRTVANAAKRVPLILSPTPTSTPFSKSPIAMCAKIALIVKRHVDSALNQRRPASAQSPASGAQSPVNGVRGLLPALASTISASQQRPILTHPTYTTTAPTATLAVCPTETPADVPVA